MADDPTQNPSEALTPAQQALAEVWERHLASEFETKSATEAVSTMVPEAYVNHIPVLTGGLRLAESASSPVPGRGRASRRSD